jgi:hypothetical protein
MKRISFLILLLLLLPAAIHGQSKSKWLQGEWVGTGLQIDDGNMWAMRLTANKKRYVIEYPSLGCGGRWKLVSISGGRAIFRERITKWVEKCAPLGNVVIERLSRRQLAFWYSYKGSNEFVASAILNKQQ